MSFVFYNTAVQVYSREEAKRRLALFNARFAAPLATCELRGIEKSVDRVVNVRGQKGFYLLSARKLIDLLGLSPEESREIGFFASKRVMDRAIAKETTRKKREERDLRIIELYRAGDRTQAQVAKIVGCSERTVASVLKKAGLTKRISRRLHRQRTTQPAPMRRSRMLPSRIKRDGVVQSTRNDTVVRRKQVKRAFFQTRNVNSTCSPRIAREAISGHLSLYPVHSAKKCLTSLRGVGSLPLYIAFCALRT